MIRHVLTYFHFHFIRKVRFMKMCVCACAFVCACAHMCVGVHMHAPETKEGF
jgi:hypothetical protein